MHRQARFNPYVVLVPDVFTRSTINLIRGRKWIVSRWRIIRLLAKLKLPKSKLISPFNNDTVATGREPPERRWLSEPKFQPFNRFILADWATRLADKIPSHRHQIVGPSTRLSLWAVNFRSVLQQFQNYQSKKSRIRSEKQNFST